MLHGRGFVHCLPACLRCWAYARVDLLPLGSCGFLSRVSCSERLCENPEFANRVPTSTPRAWGAHADHPHFLLPSMPFLGLAPLRPDSSHSLASC
jgi:hypothetical protein